MNPLTAPMKTVARRHSGLKAWLPLCLWLVFAPAWAQDDPAGDGYSDYRLGPGDKLQIDVFNEPGLTGEYTLDGNGRFSMHLIG